MPALGASSYCGVCGKVYKTALGHNCPGPRSSLYLLLKETPMTAPRTYPVELTADQIFGFSDLVRRLARAYGPGEPLRHDLASALEEFAALLPEPSEEDGEAYCDATDNGSLPRWGMDLLPLTQPAAEYNAALSAAVKARAA